MKVRRHCTLNLFCLTHTINFDDDSDRDSSISHLGDILQSLPEVYKTMVTIGGTDTRYCISAVSEHIKRTTSTTISEFCHKILMKARSLLDCHPCGILTFHCISEDESVFNAGSDVNILLKQCISVREAVDPSEQIKVYLRYISHPLPPFASYFDI